MVSKTTEDIAKNVIKELTKEIDAKIDKALEAHTVSSVLLSALGNNLVKRSIRLGVDKNHFLKCLSDGWDYYLEV